MLTKIEPHALWFELLTEVISEMPHATTAAKRAALARQLDAIRMELPRPTMVVGI
jgi:hypothetical protein